MAVPEQHHLRWHPAVVTAEERARCLGQPGCVVWLTGLSGSGKSTLARAVEQRLIAAGHAAYVLDGDNLRHGLNADLGFLPADRTENIRRVGEVAALMADAGLIVITAFISPYLADRERARRAAGAARFLEVYLSPPPEVCEARDPKGLYKKARAGELPDFTGVSAPYEPPVAADAVIDTGSVSIDEAVEQLLAALRQQGVFS